MEQRGLFTEEFWLRRLSELGDNLEKLGCIDWELFRPEIEKSLAARKAEIKKQSTSKPKEESHAGGRPAFDCVMMFKILVLERYYNMSDDQAEFQITDRMSFRRFLGLGLDDKIPDAKTIWKFRNDLSQKDHDTAKELFSLFEEKLETESLIGNEGTIVDATFVEAPRQRNTRDENRQIKEGKTPEDWKPSNDTHCNKTMTREDLRKKHRLCQKDTDARWTKKNDVNYYGYKSHNAVDSSSKLVKNYDVTAANMHDSNRCGELLDEKDRVLYADSAYTGPAVLDKLPGNVNEIHICEKGVRNRPLTGEQKRRNSAIAKVRCRIEHVFGFMTRSMHELKIRGIGMVRARFDIGLINLVYNMFRYSYLVARA